MYCARVNCDFIDWYGNKKVIYFIYRQNKTNTRDPFFVIIIIIVIWIIVVFVYSCLSLALRITVILAVFTSCKRKIIYIFILFSSFFSRLLHVSSIHNSFGSIWCWTGGILRSIHCTIHPEIPLLQSLNFKRKHSIHAAPLVLSPSKQATSISPKCLTNVFSADNVVCVGMFVYSIFASGQKSSQW